MTYTEGYRVLLHLCESESFVRSVRVYSRDTIVLWIRPARGGGSEYEVRLDNATATVTVERTYGATPSLSPDRLRKDVARGATPPRLPSVRLQGDTAWRLAQRTAEDTLREEITDELRRVPFCLWKNALGEEFRGHWGY